MGLELFDLALEGTSVRDCLKHQEEDTRNAVVIDRGDTYGSTYRGFLHLSSSKYVRNCVLNREVSAETHPEILIEAIPFLMRPTDDDLLKMKKTGMMTLLRFIKIETHYYIDSSGNAHKIPYTKTDVADSETLTLGEKMLFSKLLRRKITFIEFSQALSDKSREILVEGIAGGRADCGVLRRYVQNFGDVPFIYPQHGLKEISEVFARCNAMCGTAYVLDRDLSVTELPEQDERGEEDVVPLEYRYRIDTRYGAIYTKRLVRSKCDNEISYVRVVNTKKEILGRTFFASVNARGSMKVIGLNSDSECCSEGTYLIYVIRNDSNVTEDDLKLLKIEDEDILKDISYETRIRFDFDHAR